MNSHAARERPRAETSRATALCAKVLVGFRRRRSPWPAGALEADLYAALRADPGFPHNLGQAWWMANSWREPGIPEFTREQHERAYRLRHPE